MTELTTHTLDVPGAVLTYDVHEPEEPGDHRPLFIFGSPMGASGFEQLVNHFRDRTVITYDPRGMERSTRTPGGEPGLSGSRVLLSRHREIPAWRHGARLRRCTEVSA